MFTLLQLLDAFPSPVTSNVKHSENWTLQSSEAIRQSLTGHKQVMNSLEQNWLRMVGVRAPSLDAGEWRESDAETAVYLQKGFQHLYMLLGCLRRIMVHWWLKFALNPLFFLLVSVLCAAVQKEICSSFSVLVGRESFSSFPCKATSFFPSPRKSKQLCVCGSGHMSGSALLSQNSSTICTECKLALTLPGVLCLLLSHSLCDVPCVVECYQLLPGTHWKGSSSCSSLRHVLPSCVVPLTPGTALPQGGCANHCLKPPGLSTMDNSHFLWLASKLEMFGSLFINCLLLSFKCKMLTVTALLGKILLSFKPSMLCPVCAVSISILVFPAFDCKAVGGRCAPDSSGLSSGFSMGFGGTTAGEESTESNKREKQHPLKLPSCVRLELIWAGSPVLARMGTKWP
ncbi:hypothetical protein EK904_007126 [Melospiza melodia maxima]|nr:hypothetical protein EK904_007126 [Melospiza melodia maxima]